MVFGRLTAKFRRTASLRYYLYISDSKLDMLFEQIPPKLRTRFAAEVKVDLKVVGVALTSAQPTTVRTAKLRLIERYLESETGVGSVDEPQLYFRGGLPMEWGYVGSQEPGQRRGVVFMSKGDGLTVALIGSHFHVLGHQRADPDAPMSAPPDLYETVQDRGPSRTTHPPGEARSSTETGAAIGATLGLETSQSPTLELPSRLVTAISELTIDGDYQELEFLAMRLGDGRLADGRRVLVGSPLFVALGD